MVMYSQWKPKTTLKDACGLCAIDWSCKIENKGKIIHDFTTYWEQEVVPNDGVHIVWERKAAVDWIPLQLSSQANEPEKRPSTEAGF
ncbi:hypothetical protein AAF712_015704 [Marasmius tenuissimus]|uniref:Uncharacterized protein n=1 Tax=Marasmius tenuissimus TaxID=585030 RepID=A0ABR2Z9Q6_9AGAR